MRRDSNTYTPGMAVTLVSEKTKVRGLSAREVYTVKQNQTQSAPKKKDFVTLVDAHGKDHKINVHANGEKLELGAIGEIELQAGDRLWFRANSSGVTNGTLASLAGTDEQGRLVTTGGFVVPEDYLKIAQRLKLETSDGRSNSIQTCDRFGYPKSAVNAIQNTAPRCWTCLKCHCRTGQARPERLDPRREIRLL